MPSKLTLQPQNPLLLRCHRLIEAFAKSDDEKDFFLDRYEGFILSFDLEKTEPELQQLEEELKESAERYCIIPKITFYETKKIMEGFVNEKVYDIDTKEKMMEIIQSKESMANFLDFLNDHHAEFEKWQQYYVERSRVRIIEWLRQNHFTFVFEEDLDFPRDLIEKLKRQLFESKVGKDILNARKELANKAKTYYSNEALNPRPKRGRPPKQTTKPEIEPQITSDIFTTVPAIVRPFLFTPSPTQHPATAFASRYENLIQKSHRRKSPGFDFDLTADSLKEKLSILKKLSNKWVEQPSASASLNKTPLPKDNFEDDDEDDELDHAEVEAVIVPKKKTKAAPPPPPPKKKPEKNKAPPPPPPPPPPAKKKINNVKKPPPPPPPKGKKK